MAQGHFPALKHLILEGPLSDQDCSRQLLPEHWPCLETLDLDCGSHLLGCHVVQMVGKLSHLKHLLLYTGHYDSADFDALLQLPSCVDVHVMACQHVLHAEALARASSAQLHMVLTLNSGKEPQQLVTSTWPSLVSLTVWGDQTSRNNAIIRSLAGAQWPAIISLSFCVKFTPSAVRSISQAMSGQLRVLQLSYCELKADHFQALQQGSWPVLEEFTAELASLETEHINHLVKCDWPLLKVLNLNNNKLAAAAMELLASAKWPVLQQVHLLAADINLEGSEALAKGDWPMLQELCFSGQEDAHVLAGLRQAQWPLLQQLVYYGGVGIEDMHALFPKSQPVIVALQLETDISSRLAALCRYTVRQILPQHQLSLSSLSCQNLASTVICTPGYLLDSPTSKHQHHAPLLSDVCYMDEIILVCELKSNDIELYLFNSCVCNGG